MVSLPGSSNAPDDRGQAHLRLSTAAAVQLVIGHVAVVVGWFLLLVGGAFFWGFVMPSDLVSARAFDADLARTSARVERVARQGRRGADVYVDFTYEVGEERFAARSYAANEELVPAEPVAEYVVDDPSRARLVGLDAYVVRGGLFFLIGVVVAGALALLLLVAGSRAGLHNRAFFARARRGVGRVVAQNRSSNESRVVTVELECTDAARPSACWRTQLVMSHADAWPVGTAGIPLIYDPEEPGRAMAVTRLECGVRLREQGQIMAGGGWLAAGLVAPLACITANVIAALSWAA